MKKIFITLAMIAAVSVACQKQEIVGHVAESEGTFTATVENFDTSTKTTLATNNHILWSSGDRLAIFQGSSLADEYVLSENSAGKMNGIFNLAEDNSEVNGSFSAGAELPCNVAVYPYAAGLSLSGSTFGRSAFDIEGLSLPATQEYTACSFANGAFPMVTVTKSMADHDLCFRNILGAMKLQLKGTQVVKSVKIKGGNGEKLAGDATVIAYSNNLAPELMMSSDASAVVTLDCGAGVQLNETEATDFIVALPPVVFEKGFTVTITDSADETYSISAKVQNTISRSTILTMSPLILGDSGEVTPDEEQVFSVKFKDQIFEDYMVAHYDLDLDGFLSYEEAEKVVALDLASKNITDFTGIEHLVNLETLDCSKNKMTELYLKTNTKLKMLICDSCSSLDTLNLSGCESLENFTCSGSDLRVLDLRAAIKLRYLKIVDLFDLQEIKFKDASALEYVSIGPTYSTQSLNLKNIDLSTCSSLRELDLAGSGLMSLNVDACKNLEILDCSGTRLVSLNLSKCRKLTSLNFVSGGAPQISYLELGDIPYITAIRLNAAQSIKVSGSKVESISCGGDSKYRATIQSVDFSECPNLQSVSIYKFKGELNLSNLKNLKEVYIQNANISQFNFGKSENIESLTFSGAQSYDYWSYIYISNWDNLYLPKLKSFSTKNLHTVPPTLDLSNSPLLELLDIKEAASSLQTIILDDDVQLDENSVIPETVTLQYR